MEVDGSAVTVAAAEAAGGVLDPLDLRVQSLGDRVGDGPLAPVQERRQAASHRACQPLHRLQATSARPAKPVLKETSGARGLKVVEEPHQRFFDCPSSRRLQLAATQGLELPS